MSIVWFGSIRTMTLVCKTQATWADADALINMRHVESCKWTLTWCKCEQCPFKSFFESLLQAKSQCCMFLLFLFPQLTVIVAGLSMYMLCHVLKITTHLAFNGTKQLYSWIWWSIESGPLTLEWIAWIDQTSIDHCGKGGLSRSLNGSMGNC